MKAVVVYRSKSGFVKKYARWIAEAVGADLFRAEEVDIDRLLSYDTIIYGGGLYASGINGVDLIKRNVEKLKGRKIVVFASGASPVREDTLSEVRDRNFTPEELEHIRYFYLRGGFDFSKLAPADKVLMTLMKLKIRMKKKEKRHVDERGMLSAYSRPVDFTRKANIADLVEYVTTG